MNEASNRTDDEAARLLGALHADELAPDFLAAGIKSVSIAGRNEAAARAAQIIEPSPEGKFLGRLAFIATDENKKDLTSAFLVNLHSPDAEARLASLRGLEGLGHPALADFALASLRDGDDEVVYAACQILLPLSERDSRLRDELRSVFVSRRPDDRFKRSTNLLKANGIAAPEK